VHFACADVRGNRSASIAEGLLHRGTSLVLATVPFSDRLYYSGSKKTQPQAVRSGFVLNGSRN